MPTQKTDLLSVPGAQLYYEVRGAGPILLLIAAGAGDAESYQPLFDYLTPHFTVVTYDRRGFSRSRLNDPEQPVDIRNHSEDAHALLAMFGTEPMDVFGCSIGALIGLDLAIHYPKQVRTLVAHEAPIPALLPAAERDQIRRDQEKLTEMYRTQGAATALKQFAVELGVKHNDQNLNLGLPQKDAAAAQSNRESFFKHDTGAVARYVLDIPALKAAQTHIVPAGGLEGQQSFPYHCAVALAELLGTPLATFPGTHAGFVDYPKEFAERLINVLDHP